VRFIVWFLLALLGSSLLGAVQRTAAQAVVATPLAKPAAARKHDPRVIRASGEEPSDEYTQLVTSAVAAFDAGRFEAAHELMARAHRLNPSARTLRGMGLAAFQAQHYALAGLDFERALAEKRQPLTYEQRDEVERLQAETNLQTARYRLNGERPGSVMLIDDEPPMMDGAGFLVLDTGDHELSLRPSGGDERTLTIHAEGGKWWVLDLATLRVTADTSRPNPWASAARLQPTAAPVGAHVVRVAPPSPAARPTRPVEHALISPPESTPLAEPDASDGIRTVILSAAIGGAAIAAGIAIWQWRVRESEVDAWNGETCLDGGHSRRENCGSHERGFESAERWMWVATGATALLAGGAITFAILGGSKGEKSEQETTLRCGASPLAISCRSSF
jgi:hypothetical protein